MDKKQQEGFTLGCAIGFDLDSHDIENLLAQAGKSMEQDTCLECQTVLRTVLGEVRWQNGIKIIQARVRDTKAEYN